MHGRWKKKDEGRYNKHVTTLISNSGCHKRMKEIKDGETEEPCKRERLRV